MREISCSIQELLLRFPQQQRDEDGVRAQLYPRTQPGIVTYSTYSTLSPESQFFQMTVESQLLQKMSTLSPILVGPGPREPELEALHRAAGRLRVRGG